MLLLLNGERAAGRHHLGLCDDYELLWTKPSRIATSCTCTEGAHIRTSSVCALPTDTIPLPQPHTPSTSFPTSVIPGAMLFAKSLILAATAFASASFAKPIFKVHSGAEVAARAAAAPQLARRGLLGLPIDVPSTPLPDTIPAILVNLDTNLGTLMTGDLSRSLSCLVLLLMRLIDPRRRNYS